MNLNGPIFIVGMNGSGTTMIADCLNNHPMIFIPRYESKVIPYFYISQAKFGDLSEKKNFEKVLDDFSNTHIFHLLENNNKKIKIPNNYKNIKNKNLSSIIDLTFSYFAEKHGKKIWGDHSPKYANCLQILVDLFPKCKIVHMIRDPRDCAASFRNRFGHNIQHTAFQWKKIVQKASTDGIKLGPERYFELRYEEVTIAPEKEMKMLFDFLQLPYDSIVLNSKMPMFEYKENDFKKLRKIVPNSGKWKNALKPRQVKQIENIAGRTMERFNYKILYKAGDKELSRIQLVWHKSMSKLRASNAILKKDKAPGRFTRLARVAISSMKQTLYFKY